MADVAVDHGVEDDLPQRLRRHGEAILTQNAALREARRQRQRPVEPRDGLADHGKCVQVLLPVVHDVAGDLGAPKAPQLQQRLRVVRQELGPVEELRGLRELPVDAQPEPVEDVAHIRARAC